MTLKIKPKFLSMNKTLLYFKTWMTAMRHSQVGAKVLSLVVLLSAVPYAVYSYDGGLSEVSESLQAKNQTVTGIVEDKDGQPLIGVTVAIAGTTTGTSTDVDGKFSLSVPAGSTLTVSYLGYKTEKVNVGNRTSLTITLEDEALTTDETVIIGYGSQKKVSVTSAVSTVQSKELRQSTSASLGNALAGRLAGLTSLNSTGSQPGRDDAVMYLRGASSVNGASPLIMIDGVPRDNIRTLDANEVASVSVLKDAAATAVYGVRGANGVLLITTKRGVEGQTELNVTFDQTWQAYTREPDRVTSWEFMSMRNEARRNDGMGDEYTGKRIARSLDPLMGLDPNDPDYARKAAQRHYMYPNHDYYREVMKKWSPQTRVNLNVTGGTDKLKYFVNAAYLHQGGNLNVEGKDRVGYNSQTQLDRYNFRSNLDYQITKSFKAYLNLGSYIEKVGMPNAAEFGGDTNWMIRDLIHQTLGWKPMSAGPLTPDESLGFNVIPGKVIRPRELDRSPYEMATRRGYRQEMRSNLNASLGADWKLDFITKGLSMDGMVSFDAKATSALQGTKNEMSFWADVRETADEMDFPVDRENDGTMSLEKSANSLWTLNMQYAIRYNRTFGKHDVSAMILAQRDNKEVAGGDSETLMPYNIISLAARASYGYDNRYFIEASMGYNGSEQFSPKNRFGLFPSVSGSWVISNEKFLKGNNVLTNLKLRASFGKSGSDAGGRFLYLNNHTYTSGGAMSSLSNGWKINEGRMGNDRLKWEVKYTQNYGVDLQLWSDLSLSFDYYYEKRRDVLLGPQSVPILQGYSQSSLPKMNLGKIDNQGYEIELTYNKAINKDWFVSVRGNFSYNHNTVKYYDETPRSDSYVYRNRTTGFSLSQQWGYRIDWSNGNGYFNTQEELDRYTEGYVDENGREIKGIQYNVGKAPQLGDFKYIDMNNDGVIDERDQVPIGYSSMVPRVSYGITASVNYKWFDFMIFFQGVGKYSSYYNDQGVSEDVLQGTFFKYHKSAWTAERYAAGEKITYPHLSTGRTSSKIANDFFIMDRSFIRLKNVELGYTLPQTALRAIGIKKLRVYVSGQNLFTWDRLKTSTTDPEQDDKIGYPIYKTWNVGFNITF